MIKNATGKKIAHLCEANRHLKQALEAQKQSGALAAVRMRVHEGLAREHIAQARFYDKASREESRK